jgi:predicted Rossmann-fold nucleotide-binding protein
VRKRAGRVVEIDSLEEFDDLVGAGATRMRGWRLQDIDLRARTEVLLTLDPAGAVLLGPDLTEPARRHLLDGGALIFPDLPKLPFDAYRARLYTADELYDGIGHHRYAETPDAMIYGWSCQRDLDATHRMARALHDHAIDEALDEALADTRAVGVMGGHRNARGHPEFAQAADLGRALTRAGLAVVTGGGPGAMEAANLGAYISGYDDQILRQALDLLSAVPGFHPSVTRWARAAFAVRERWPDGTATIGIPTWFYGHEPPNAFATGIAKYFQNSLREDTLLRHCDAGIVFLPGAAGTVQEIFQDACENYYADAATVTPMVLVGRDYWTDGLPVWPLLQALAADTPMTGQVHLVDSVDDAVAVIQPQ